METGIFYTTFIPIGAMYLYMQEHSVLTHTTSIPVGGMYIHARMFCTLAHDFYTRGCDEFPCWTEHFHVGQKRSVHSTHNFYTSWFNVFICKNVLYTHSYYFHTHGCDVFTCKNILNTRSHDFYTCGWDVFTGKNVLYISSYNFYTSGCNVFTCKNVCTLSDTILYPLRAPIFTMITKVWARANRAVVTNNLTVIIEVMLIKVVLTDGFQYLYCNL